MDAKTAVKLLHLLSAGEQLLRDFEQLYIAPSSALVIPKEWNQLSEIIQSVVRQTSQADTPNRIHDIHRNLEYYINRLKEAQAQSPNSILFDLRYHLSSLFKILSYEVAYIVEDFVNKADFPEFYPDYQQIDHESIIQAGKDAKYQVSIVLLAYNNLSYVRQCVESILEHTNDVAYELILVDNGSTDGTKAYFDSIPGAKVIHLEYNLHVVKGFNIGMMAAEGKYTAAVCNDFIFTHHWLSNLIICMESDPNIGYASPGATSISNFQQISVPFHTIAEFQKEAKKFNVSDPRKWEERVVLLPNVLCCPTALLSKIGYYDTRFYRGEFADDDISFRIRRAGFKLMYCADTVTHHYGSITTASDHQTNSLKEGKGTFFKKHGLDAWDDARCSSIYQQFQYENLAHAKSILGIDVKCGASFIQIKNHIWKLFGIHPTAYAATTEEKYLLDLSTITSQAYAIQTISNLTEQVNESFDLIYIEASLDCFPEHIESIFSSLAKILKPQGQLIFRLDNCSSFSRIMSLLQSIPNVHNKKIYMEQPVISCAERHGFLLNRMLNLMTSDSTEAIHEFCQIFSNEPEDIDQLENLLKRDGTYYQMTFHGSTLN